MEIYILLQEEHNINFNISQAQIYANQPALQMLDFALHAIFFL